MANANRPSGLSPWSTLTGAPWNGQPRLYSIAAAYASAIAIGDPVKTTGSADSYGYPNISLAAAGEPIRGVVVGIGTQRGLIANPGNLDSTIRPAAAQATDWYALVVDDPTVVYSIQASSALAAADIGLNADVTAGANNGFVSGYVMAAPTAAGATAQLRILGLVDSIDNTYGLYAKVLVKINEDELTSATGT